MIISKNAHESYLKVKSKIENPSLSLTDEDFLFINEIYSEITEKPVSKGCSGCLETAYKIIRNYYAIYGTIVENTYKVKRTRKPKI